MLADNSSHLRAAARLKHETTRQRALEALARLEADGTRVTVTALAKAASVARSWIYTQPDLMERIAAAPDRPAKPAPNSNDRRILATPARAGPPTDQRPHRGKQAIAHPARPRPRPASRRTDHLG